MPLSAPRKSDIRPATFFSNNPGVVACGDIIRTLLFRPTEQLAQLEIAIAGDARIRRAPVEIVLRKRSNHGLDKLFAKIQEGVIYAEQRRDFLGTVMVGAVARTGLLPSHRRSETP